jgi:hypothetical protein
MPFGEPHPYPERRSHTDGASRGNKERVIVYNMRLRIAPEAWMYVCYEYCSLSGTGLCDGLITRPEESYRVWCV